MKNILPIGNLVFILSLFETVVFAQIGETDTSVISYTRMNINNISTIIYSNGVSDNINGNSGFIYPKGTNKTAVFMSGFLWGAVVDSQIRTGGSAYRSGLLPGRIMEDGKRQDLKDPDNRIFRVRRDFKISDLSGEISDEKKSYKEIFDRYQRDWNEWPAKYGAPYEDIDGDGKYDPVFDIPGVPGADQTIWFAANDLDSVQTKYLYGSPPMGIEAQYTIWAYNAVPPLVNMIFKKLKIINKSRSEFKDMYIGLWSDPDLGDAGDDLVGCDTTLDLGYVYNSSQTDATYSPLNPPAVGSALLLGPLVEGTPDDIGYSGNKQFRGKKNLGMTGFSFIYKSYDPYQGSYESGTLQLYFYLQGLYYNGNPYAVPEAAGGGYTRFPFSGDPITKKGFTPFTPGVDYYGLPGDKRMMPCTGPFNLAASDTQEIVMAQITAGAVEGVTNLYSIDYLRRYTAAARDLFNTIKPLVNLHGLHVSAVPADRSIVLNWILSRDQKELIENDNYIYGFEGYNIYQCPSPQASRSEYRLIATYDRIDGVSNIIDLIANASTNELEIKLVQPGSDSGIRRFIRIDRDYLKDAPLNNGSDYYFGLSHYSYAGESFFPKYYESPVTVVRTTLADPPPGERFGASFGDSIAADHVSGSSTAEVSAYVVDPGSLTGDNYSVSFHSDNDQISFDLVNTTTGKVLASGEKNLRGDFDYLVTEGFVLRVKNNNPATLTDSDSYSFTTPAPVSGREAFTEDLNKINVFPNPFYAYNSNAVMPNERYITFSHLVKGAVIKIFNLAGQLVKKLVNENETQFLRWNLLNDSDFMIPSGIYLAYVQIPDSGQIKILKFAIIQGEYIHR